MSSVQRDGQTPPYNSTDFHKNLRKLCLENKQDGPAICWWNVRLQELTLSASCIEAMKTLGRDGDLDQISAWCSLE